MRYDLRRAGGETATGLPAAAVIAGVRDGAYDGLDAVRGPGEAWTAIEQHPAFTDAVAEVEFAPPRPREDDTHLDMNPLIDVCLVLLIFFILTASYEQLRKVLEMPSATTRNAGRAVLSPKEAKERTIAASVRLEGGKAVYAVEGDPVPVPQLRERLSRLVQASNKAELLLDVGPGVEWGQVVEMMDAARGAGIKKTLHRKAEAVPAS